MYALRRLPLRLPSVLRNERFWRFLGIHRQLVLFQPAGNLRCKCSVSARADRPL